MKRSNGIALALMGVGAVALSVYRGPSEIVGGVFTDTTQCTRSGIAADDCENARQVALASHRAQAPRYASREICEAATDTNCETAFAQDASFAPAMGGFAMSKDCDYYSLGCPSASRPSGSGAAYFGGRWAVRNAATPVDESRRWRGSYRSQSAFVGQGAVGERGRASIKTETVSRGGFGLTLGYRAGG